MPHRHSGKIVLRVFSPALTHTAPRASRALARAISPCIIENPLIPARARCRRPRPQTQGCSALGLQPSQGRLGDSAEPLSDAPASCTQQQLMSPQATRAVRRRASPCQAEVGSEKNCRSCARSSSARTPCASWLAALRGAPEAGSAPALSPPRPQLSQIKNAFIAPLGPLSRLSARPSHACPISIPDTQTQERSRKSHAPLLRGGWDVSGRENVKELGALEAQGLVITSWPDAFRRYDACGATPLRLLHFPPLTVFSHSRRRHLPQTLLRLGPNNIVHQDGQRHAFLRKLLVPAFAPRRLAEILPLAQAAVTADGARWAAGPQPLRLYPEAKRLSTALIVQARCGADAGRGCNSR